MFLHDGQEFERHAAGFLCARLPLLHGRFTGVEITGEDRLADAETLAKRLDLARLDWGGRGETGFIEAAHRGFVDGASTNHPGNGGVDCFKRVRLVFTILLHGILVMQTVAPGATVFKMEIGSVLAVKRQNRNR